MENKILLAIQNFDDLTNNNSFLIENDQVKNFNDSEQIQSIDAVDAKTIYRLLWLNNAIIVRNKFTSFVVFPIDIKNRLGLLVFFSEQMRDEISQAGTYDQESEILSKIKKIVSLISAICQSKNNLNENFLVYWVSSSIGENVKRVAEVKDKDLSDNNEKVFFAYQEKISRSLKIFDQKQAIKYFNKLQYLAPIDDYPYRHDREKKERYLRRLLISFTSSLSDHLIDSNVSIDDVTKLRMKVINDLMITRLSGNFYKEMNNIIWKFFALFKQSSMLHDSDMALKCKNYIDDHLNDGVSLKDVYKNLHYFNKKKLSHDFNRRFGTTVKHYILSKKIDTSKELLSQNKLSLQEISNRLGFVDKSYFIKIFHQIVGITPKQFKKRIFE